MVGHGAWSPPRAWPGCSGNWGKRQKLGRFSGATPGEDISILTSNRSVTKMVSCVAKGLAKGTC